MSAGGHNEELLCSDKPRAARKAEIGTLGGWYSHLAAASATESYTTSRDSFKLTPRNSKWDGEGVSSETRTRSIPRKSPTPISQRSSCGQVLAVQDFFCVMLRCETSHARWLELFEGPGQYFLLVLFLMWRGSGHELSRCGSCRPCNIPWAHFKLHSADFHLFKETLPSTCLSHRPHRLTPQNDLSYVTFSFVLTIPLCPCVHVSATDISCCWRSSSCFFVRRQLCPRLLQILSAKDISQRSEMAWLVLRASIL